MHHRPLALDPQAPTQGHKAAWGVEHTMVDHMCQAQGVAEGVTAENTGLKVGGEVEAAEEAEAFEAALELIVLLSPPMLYLKAACSWQDSSWPKA